MLNESELSQESARAAEEGTRSSGQPYPNALFPLGVNYYPLDSEMQDSDEWYPGDIAGDFATFAQEHVTQVRIFISWRVFEPQAGQYSEGAEGRLQEIVEAARSNRLQLIVCFFGDDRLSGMLDISWGGKRDSYSDSYLIQQQVALVERIVSRYRTEPSVYCWDLANEPFCTGFSSAEEMSSWVATMRRAIREIDPQRPLMLSVDQETFFRRTGIDARDVLEPFEIAVSHATAQYRAYATEGPMISGPSTYLDSFLLRSASRGAPVLLDEIGVHSLDYSHTEEAAAVRTMLYSGLMNRGAGVLLRRWRDMDTRRRELYFSDPFEALVGVRDVKGEAKAAMREVDAFVRVASRLDLEHFAMAPERCAILIPEERYSSLPDLACLNAPRACLRSYICAKEAHLPVAIAHERDGFEAYAALIIPSASNLDSATWARLSAWVQGGGFLVCSYGGGESPQIVRELFGIEFLGDGGGRDTLSCRIAQPELLGSLTSFDSTIKLSAFALLGQGGSTIVATDETGNPLLTINSHGQGRAVYCAAPLELALAQADPWYSPPEIKDFLRTFYGAAARAAGCGAPVRCNSPDVELALFAGDGEDILLALNHSSHELTAEFSFDRVVATIADVRGGAQVAVGERSFGTPIAANGALALRLT